MTRDTRALLRDLARHRRDEEAQAMRRLRLQLDELNQAVELLDSEIGCAELGMRQRIADPFERSAGESYLLGLRGRLAELRQRREEIRVELTACRNALENRVIRHRQMERVCDLGESRTLREAGRSEELQCDDLAAGGWHRTRSGGLR